MIILVPGLQLSCSDDTLVSFRETEAISDKEIRKMRPDWREVPRGDIRPCCDDESEGIDRDDATDV